jgi:hypothetical protein
MGLSQRQVAAILTHVYPPNHLNTLGVEPLAAEAKRLTAAPAQDA